MNMTLDRINSTPMLYNASNQLQASTAVPEESIVNNSDIMNLDDSQYSQEYKRACKDLADLKRIEKSLKNPDRMDLDIYNQIKDLSESNSNNTYSRIQKLGLAAIVATALPFIPAFICVGAGAALASSLAVATVGSILYFGASRRAGSSYLDQKNMDAIIAEARNSIGPEISGSEARLEEMRKNAIQKNVEKIASHKESPKDMAPEKDSLQDENDYIVIGGIKLKKHAEAPDEKNGGLMKFIKNSVCHIA
ncbi:MAG: hypothetical protein AB2L14_08645 [Candidatus Xenobiia bacterium LiM19]